MADTLRNIIDEKIARVKEIDAAGGEEATMLLKELSSLLSLTNKECSERKYWYNQKLKLCLEEQKGIVGKAKVHAEASPEYKSWMDCEGYKQSLKENMSALKYFLRNLETERRESRY